MSKIGKSIISIEKENSDTNIPNQTPKQNIQDSQTKSNLSEPNVIQIEVEEFKDKNIKDDVNLIKDNNNKYLELIKSKISNDLGYFDLQKMKTAMSVLVDIKSIYIASFNALSLQGLSKEKLIENCNSIKKTIDDENIHFGEIFKEQTNIQLGEAKKEIDTISLEITKLRKTLDEYESSLKEKQKKYNEMNDKFLLKKTQFFENSSNLKQQIDNELLNINKFL